MKKEQEYPPAEKKHKFKISDIKLECGIEVKIDFNSKCRSSGKSVGEFRFGEFSHREKQCDFKDFIASKAERFSRNEIYFAIQALDNA